MSCQPPKLHVESELREQRLGLLGSVPAPARCELLQVPSASQARSLVERQHVSDRPGLPLSCVIFRPEEPDRSSREVDVLPEVLGAHAHVHHGAHRGRGGAVAIDVDDDPLAAVKAR